MSDANEQVIERAVYEVGMTVRLRNGDTHTITSDNGGGIGDCPLVDDVNRTSWERDGMWAIEPTKYDIIGEVVTAPVVKVATKAAKAYTTVITVDYGDGMKITKGMVSGVSIECRRHELKVARRAVDRYAVQAAIHGWEV